MDISLILGHCPDSQLRSLDKERRDLVDGATASVVVPCMPSSPPEDEVVRLMGRLPALARVILRSHHIAALDALPGPVFARIKELEVSHVTCVTEVLHRARKMPALFSLKIEERFTTRRRSPSNDVDLVHALTPLVDRLRAVNLSFNNVDAPELIQLILTLPNPSLKIFAIQGVRVGGRGLGEFLTLLPALPIALRVLRISGGCIEVDGAVALAGAIARSRIGLRRLEVVDCCIGDLGCKALAQCLMTPGGAGIDLLDVSRNGISAEGRARVYGIWNKIRANGRSINIVFG